MDNLQLDSDEFQELRKQIAIKHGYSLSNEDPILMFVTLNEFLLNQYKQANEYCLMELSDIVFNTKTDINNYLKEQELALLRKIQEVNNKNVLNVHEKIKEYFMQEAEVYKQLKINIIKDNNLLKLIGLINFIGLVILIILSIVK